RLQALFQGNRLHLPPGHPEAQTMTDELLDYEICVDKNANDTYGAFRVGTHDDLVTALGLATQEDANRVGGALAKEMEGETPPAPPDLTIVPNDFQGAERRTGSRWRERQTLLKGTTGPGSP